PFPGAVIKAVVQGGPEGRQVVSLTEKVTSCQFDRTTFECPPGYTEVKDQRQITSGDGSLLNEFLGDGK
ncbi:MAG: hypothetical protein ACRD3W_16285, partial [Terriglobales bacterium]